MFGLFREKKTKLYNGKEVKEGDCVYFINSDGVRCEGKIQRRKESVKLQSPSGHLPRFQEKHNEMILKKGTLFFWNSGFLITDYINADLC